MLLDLQPLVELHGIFGKNDRDARSFWKVWLTHVEFLGLERQLRCCRWYKRCLYSDCGMFEPFTGNSQLYIPGSIPITTSLQNHLKKSTRGESFSCFCLRCMGRYAQVSCEPAFSQRVLSIRLKRGHGLSYLDKELYWGGAEFEFASAVFEAESGDVGSLISCGPDAPHLYWFVDSQGCSIWTFDEIDSLLRCCVACFYMRSRPRPSN